MLIVYFFGNGLLWWNEADRSNYIKPILLNYLCQSRRENYTILLVMVYLIIVTYIDTPRYNKIY